MTKPGHNLEDVELEFSENGKTNFQSNSSGKKKETPKPQDDVLTTLRTRLSEIAVQIHVLESKAQGNKSLDSKTVDDKLENIRAEYFELKAKLDSISPPKHARRQFRF